MSPAVIPGDHVLVNKWAYGARLFDIWELARGKRVRIRRIPGYQNVRRNDIVVFNYPYPHTKQKIAMSWEQYYIKRCIAVAGDTLWIRNGFYQINGDSLGRVGDYEAQKAFSEKTKKLKNYKSYPWDSIIGWTIREFGPLYIPKKGDTLLLDRTRSVVYKKLIEWEKGVSLVFRRDTLWEGARPVLRHIFTHDYYFMGGDRVESSKDSRYWGLLPDEFIAGKACLVWKSIDPYSGAFRFKRWLHLLK